MDVSVVIPTRNRRESLLRLLSSLSKQTYAPHEVIIVDSSDSPLELTTVQEAFAQMKIRLYLSHPSVCAQRNKGIREAASTYVFLCDDDVEVPREYLERLLGFLNENPRCGAVSGVVVEPGIDGAMNDGLFPISPGALFKAFVFQLTVWADVNTIKADFPTSILLRCMKWFYAWRGNTFTFAGWPLLTQITYPILQTSIYGLGASLVRRDWLLISPFDEHLDQNGLGDNYGVALGFPLERPITVLTGVPATNHKAVENRLGRTESYMKRVLALHYFMTVNKRFSFMNRLLLLWSIFGQLLSHSLNQDREMTRATVGLLVTLVRRRNPYLLRFNRKGR